MIRPKSVLAALLLCAAGWTGAAVPEPPTASTQPATLPGMLGSTAAYATAGSTESVVAAAEADASTEPAHEAVPGPWVLGEIAVSGNRHVKAGVVRGQVKGRKGELYDRPDLDRDIQSLYGLGSFERVSADVSLTDKPVPAHLKSASGAPAQVKLTIIVRERAVVKKVRFQGNKKLGKGVLRDATALKEKDPLDTLKLREDEDKILAKYKEKGYLHAEVSSEVKLDTTTHSAEIVYTMVEGARSRIDSVAVPGVKSFKPRKILKQLANKRKKTFKEKELAEDVGKIETFYKNNGYLDVSVGSATVTWSEDKTKVFISIPVEEGRAYKFGETSFAGHYIYASTDLVKAIEYKKGKIFNNEKYEATIRGIQELYADKGRLRARVTPAKTLNAATDRMDVHLTIAEGDISYIDHVDVEGNKATKTYVLRREVIVKPGEMFSFSRIRRSQERIMNLGFIDDVGIDIQQSGNDPDKVDLTFDVAEGKPGLLTAGAAFSSTDGLIGTLSLQHMNLFGRAQRANVQWNFGRRVQDYSVSWLTPWVFNRPVSFGLDLFNTRRVSAYQTSLNAYVTKRRGVGVQVGPRFKEGIYHLNFNYTYEQISIDNVQPLFQGVLAEGTSIFSTLGVSFARDTRDSYWDPTRGSRNEIRFGISGGPLQGDINLFETALTNSAHFKLFSLGEYPFVLSFNNRFATITQFDTTKEVPVFRRYFVGGQDSLRGYSPSGEVGYPSGGKVLDVFNLEFGFPLARERKRTIVKFVVFFDMGSSWDAWRTVDLKIGSGERNLKTNAGFGIRFTTPAFPIRLDYGYGFNHRNGEKLYQINFGLGNLF